MLAVNCKIFLTGKKVNIRENINKQLNNKKIKYKYTVKEYSSTNELDFFFNYETKRLIDT